MATSDPLGLDAFANLLRLEHTNLRPNWQQQRSVTGGGETRYADRAPMLWTAQPSTVPMENGEAEGLMALINSRGGGLRTVLLFNSRLPFPASDPDGAIIGATIPKLGVIADRLHVAFTGFPVGYILPVGTYFGLTYDTSRRYLGQLVEARTANGAGAVASVEVWPPLPASVVGALDVTVAKPPARFRITPGSAYISEQSTIHAVVTFAAEQTLSR